MFAVVVFHRIYESVGLGNASFDHQPPSKLVAPVRDSIVRPAHQAVKRFCPLKLPGFHRVASPARRLVLELSAVYHVYIVRCADGTLYTGYARNPTDRVKVHNAGRGARYTSGRRPVRLIYSESFETVGDALRRERALKKQSRAQKEALAGCRVSRSGSGRRGGSN